MKWSEQEWVGSNHREFFASFCIPSQPGFIENIWVGVNYWNTRSTRSQNTKTHSRSDNKRIIRLLPLTTDMENWELNDPRQIGNSFAWVLLKSCTAFLMKTLSTGCRNAHWSYKNRYVRGVKEHLEILYTYFLHVIWGEEATQQKTLRIFRPERLDLQSSLCPWLAVQSQWSTLTLLVLNLDFLSLSFLFFYKQYCYKWTISERTISVNFKVRAKDD